MVWKQALRGVAAAEAACAIELSVVGLDVVPP